MRSLTSGLVRLAARCELFEVASIAISARIGKARESHHAPTVHSDDVIDAVYLWVDDSDPEWLQRKSSALGTETAHAKVGASRFRQHGELTASLAMLAKNAPFIRRVFIVTDNQLPPVHDLANVPFEIRVINHSDFMPAEFLPTYSSRALTANLHRIGELSEKFLYLNDDVFITRTAQPSNWFAGDKIVLRYTDTEMPSRVSLAADEVVYNARWRTIDLANSRQWPNIDGMPQHGAHPFLKSALQELWNEFPEDMQRVSASRVRTADGLLPEWLHNLYVNSQGKARIESGSYKYIAINDRSSLPAIIHMLLKRGEFLTVCLNDVAETTAANRLEGPRLARRVRRVLRSML